MTITLTREEAEKVLEALQSVWKMDRTVRHENVIETLRERLAQPELTGEWVGDKEYWEYPKQPEPPCKTGSQCIGGKCLQCVVDKPEPVAWMCDFPNPDNPREDMICDWVAHSLEEVERCHGFNVRPLYSAPPPCQTCVSLARAVMMDQFGRC